VIFYFSLGQALERKSPAFLAIAYAFISAAYAIITAAIYILFLAYWIGRTERKSVERLPQNELVGAMVEAIGVCGNQWDDLKARSRVLLLLERSANALQYGLPHVLQPRDNATHAWFLRETKKRAQSVRDLKRVVCLSTPDAAERTIVRCREFLRLGLNGNWRGFPTTEVELLQDIKSWPVRLGQLLRQLMAAFTPLLILFGLKIVDAPLKEPAAPYLWAGAAAWALVGVVVTLDPAAKEKGEFAKDIAATVQSLRPGK
jgi:hypothetical protein